MKPAAPVTRIVFFDIIPERLTKKMASSRWLSYCQLQCKAIPRSKIYTFRVQLTIPFSSHGTDRPDAPRSFPRQPHPDVGRAAVSVAPQHPFRCLAGAAEEFWLRLVRARHSRHPVTGHPQRVPLARGGLALRRVAG